MAFLAYKEGVDALKLTDRLTESERAMLIGGTLQKVYGWAPSARPPEAAASQSGADHFVRNPTYVCRTLRYDLR